MPLEKTVTTVSRIPTETRREDVQMLLAKLTNADDTQRLTQEQLSQVIADRARVNELIREDKKDAFELAKIDRHNRLHYLYAGGVGIILLSLMVLHFKPEYFSQLLQAIVTTLGGYGIGRYQGSKKEQLDKES